VQSYEASAADYCPEWFDTDAVFDCLPAQLETIDPWWSVSLGWDVSGQLKRTTAGSLEGSNSLDYSGSQAARHMLDDEHLISVFPPKIGTGYSAPPASSFSSIESWDRDVAGALQDWVSSPLSGQLTPY